MFNKYAYLFGASFFLVYWLFVFFRFKKQQKQIIVFSIIYGLIGLFTELLSTIDYWKPETISTTRIGVEDFLFGFAIGGISTALPLFFFKIRECKNEEKIIAVLVVFFTTAIVTLLLFILFKFGSFYANIFGLFVSLVFIYCQRVDLVIVSLLSGLLLLLISLPVYFAIIFIFPGWIETTWMLDKISGFIFLGIPLEEYIWYFLAGALISITYPFYKGVYFSSIIPRSGTDNL